MMPLPGGSCSVQEKIAILVKQRGLIKGKLTRLINYVNSFDPEKDDVSEIKARSSELSTIMDNFENIQAQIEESDDTDGQELLHEEERSSMESKYYTIKGTMDKLLQESVHNLSQQFSSTINNPQDSIVSKPRVKLPQLELPTFDGALKEWPTFKNLFMCAVNSANIPILQKFQYLKSSLKGEAAGLISSLLISEDNYTKALQILTTSVMREQYWACSKWPYTQRVLAIAVGVLLGAVIGLVVTVTVTGKDPEDILPGFLTMGSAPD